MENLAALPSSVSPSEQRPVQEFRGFKSFVDLNVRHLLPVGPRGHAQYLWCGWKCISTYFESVLNAIKFFASGKHESSSKSSCSSLITKRRRVRRSPMKVRPSILLPLALMSVLMTSDSASVVHRSNEPEKDHMTIFENMGQLISDNSYIHVVSAVNLTQFDHLFFNLKSMFVKYNQYLTNQSQFLYDVYNYPYILDHHKITVFPNSTTSKANDAGISIYHRIESLESSYQNLRATLPPLAVSQKQYQAVSDIPRDVSQKINSSVYRVKRELVSFLLTLIIGSIIGTFMGIYIDRQIQNKDALMDADLLLNIDDEHANMLDNLDKRVHSAFVELARTAKIENDEVHQIWTEILNQAETRLNQLKELLQNAQYHRLAMNWFNETQLENILHGVQKHAADSKVKALITKVSDLYQIEMSYARKDDELVLILHVPTTMNDAEWTVYKYVPFPIPHSDGKIAMVTTNKKIIAIGPDGKHKIMSKATFDKCQRRGPYHICDEQLVNKKNYSTSCVGALFDSQAETIKRKCDVELMDDEEMVFPMSSTKFAIYTPLPYTASASCLHNKQFHYQIRKSTHIEIPPGCTLKLKQHEVNVPTSIVVSTDPWTFPTTWDTLETPKHILQKQYKMGFDLEQALKNESAAHHTFNDMLHDVNNKSATLHDTIQEQEHSWGFDIFNMSALSWTTAGIVCVAIGVVILYLMYRKYKKNNFNGQQVQNDLRRATNDLRLNNF